MAPTKTENTRLEKRKKKKERKEGIVTKKELRLSSLTSTTSQHVGERANLTPTDEDQRVMHTCKCMPTGESHTHICTDLYSSQLRVHIHTHTLINTASHRSSVLHVGHGIKGGGSAGV